VASLNPPKQMHTISLPNTRPLLGRGRYKQKGTCNGIAQRGLFGERADIEEGDRRRRVNERLVVEAIWLLKQQENISVNPGQYLRRPFLDYIDLPMRIRTRRRGRLPPFADSSGLVDQSPANFIEISTKKMSNLRTSGILRGRRVRVDGYENITFLVLVPSSSRCHDAVRRWPGRCYVRHYENDI